MMRRTIPIALLALAATARADGPPAAVPATAPTTLPATRSGASTVHDPSSVIRCGDAWYCFSTGVGLKSFRSTDLRTWTPGPNVFATPLPWLADVVPGNRGHLWAPDVIRLEDESGERYLLYYSISTFGKRTSAIALATSRTLDARDPNYAWTDRGVVVRSGNADDFNAIDPSVFRDPRDGRLWMTFGSFWSGIRLIELDPKTGLRIDDKPSTRVAWKKEIEASFLTAHDGKYFLFVNWGLCCRGAKSTYEIRVGRSDAVTGPYLDRDGVDLAKGGGTPVLASAGDFVGPGHAGIVVGPDGRERLTGHFYDAADNGRSHLFVRPLTWDAAGWPAVGE